jgi:ABC-type multidrug transport system ATPase subunit
MIEVNALKKQYGEINALQGVSLKVEKGELFGLIGPDGAGKTSLMRILMSLLLPDGGSATMGGYDVVNDYKKVRLITGYMPGRFSLYPDLTVEENLRFFATVFGTTIEANYAMIRDIYSQIEPFKDRRSGKLSGGMKQKLALSCALIHKPGILILDEPTTGVDAVSRKEFWEMLKQLKALGITILVSTPYMDEASLCDRIALIQEGVLLSVESPQVMMNTFPEDLWAVKSDHLYATARHLERFPGIISVNSFGQELHLVTPKGHVNPETIIAYLNERQVDNVTVEPCRASVEDVFMLLMGKRKRLQL